MRHSSMKSTVKSTAAALSITASLLFAVPTASAGTAQATRSQQTAAEREDAKNDRFAVVRQFINRALRRVVTYTGPTVPIPKNEG